MIIFGFRRVVCEILEAVKPGRDDSRTLPYMPQDFRNHRRLIMISSLDFWSHFIKDYHFISCFLRSNPFEDNWRFMLSVPPDPLNRSMQYSFFHSSSH